MALVLGIVAVSAGPLFSQPQHPACRVMQHHCGSAATIAHCCCGDGAVPKDTGTAAQSRIEPAKAAASTVAMLPKSAQGPTTAAPAIAAQTSPPRACLVDLPTLFSALLI